MTGHQGLWVNTDPLDFSVSYHTGTDLLQFKIHCRYLDNYYSTWIKGPVTVESSLFMGDPCLNFVGEPYPQIYVPTNVNKVINCPVL